MSGDFQKAGSGLQGDLLSLGGLVVSRAEGSQDRDGISPNSSPPDVSVGSATILQNREALRGGSALGDYACQGNRLSGSRQATPIGLGAIVPRRQALVAAPPRFGGA